ncbi:metallophosphoesterase family protein [Undibacterium sp. Di27W]|uniref:metallophosphoesterase family protein n=1 Tax=Undibacterium sp. Di27W TaxID=3413036 RepID=UPI003BF29F03
MTEKNVSISIGIIGDPHVVVKGETSPALHLKNQHSFFEVDNEAGTIGNSAPKQHPWLDLISLVQGENGSSPIEVDALLCVGDLGFRGSSKSIQAAWKLLQDAGNLMKSDIVACATGNHDVHSRSEAASIGKDPIPGIAKAKGIFETLKLLDPPYPLIATNQSYPLNGRSVRAQYFGEGATLYEFEKFRLLILNSCADHGHEPYEYEHGGISQSTISAIAEDLVLLKKKPDMINLALVHHPPVPDSEFNSGTLDHIHGGDELLRLLKETGQQWFFIHGHKHKGTITHPHGGITVFSAASLGMRLSMQTKGVRNQFYVVNLTFNVDVPHIMGTVDCWDWYENLGWTEARPDNGGICHGCGFGNTQTIQQLAMHIAEFANASVLPLEWSELIGNNPHLQFVMPDEMQLIKERLETRHNLTIELDKFGHWDMIARKA